MPARHYRKPIPLNTDAIELRLLLIAAGFLLLQSIALTLAPAVRAHTWAVTYRWNHWAGLAAWALSIGLVTFVARRRLPGRDPLILPVVALLAGTGILVIFRLTGHFGFRQSAWLFVSAALVSGGMLLREPLALLQRYKYLWLTGGLLLTALTFLLGVYPGGSGPNLWIRLGGLYLQPSEPLKLLILVFLAAYLADQLPRQFSLKQTLAPIGLAFLAALALLVGQHDLGTTSLIILLFAVLLYLATGRLRVLVISGLLLAVGGGLGYWLFDVVRLRVDAWINPWLDPSNRSYQVVQSLIAVASGGIFGSGIGLGSPGLVPVAQSDFIFSAIAEEGGLVFSLALLAVFALLVQRGMNAAMRSRDLFQRLLAGGISAYLGLQCILIVAGNLRLLPITGVTLPFVSYGGSSLVTSMLAAGLLLLISARVKEEPETAGLSSRPFKVIHALLLTGFIGLALGAGWWSVVRSQSLTARTDNPRRTINDRFVLRGSILDRNDNVLSRTVGQSGSYTRELVYPELSPIIGYTNPTYGQAGLEASLDDYLRGVRGYPALQQALNNLLYSQPPTGLDVRLSLGLDLQKMADDLLGSQSGAVVLLNPVNGEILALASHPTYTLAQLDTGIAALQSDPAAPLLNRTAQALYPAGTSLAAFLFADGSGSVLPETPAIEQAWIDGLSFPCALPVEASAAWPELVAGGCPAATRSLADRYNTLSLINLYQRLGFYSTPALPLEANASPVPSTNTDFNHLALGMLGVDISPLQLALAAASLSNGGVMPAPRLALSVNTPQSGWVILPLEGTERRIFSAAQADQAAEALQVSGMPFWQALGSAPLSDVRALTWYLGGTPPGWSGTPAVVVVLLETRAPYLAEYIGQSLILALQ